ncbi:MAG: ATP-dependent Clp protease adaptor ClpS [Tepidisphaeraceae bacterium]
MAENSESSSAGDGGAPSAAPKPRAKPAKKPKRQPLQSWNVVLLNDDDHTYDYVIEMLRATCGHPAERGMQLAQAVDSTGRAIVYTTHKELAELKRDLILAYGADPRIDKCQGSMSAVIEPAEG